MCVWVGVGVCVCFVLGFFDGRFFVVVFCLFVCLFVCVFDGRSVVMFICRRTQKQSQEKNLPAMN